MNEVCLSHRSFNRHNTEAYSSSLDRDSRIMVTVLNYFMNQSFIGKSPWNENKINLLQTLF